MARSRKLVRNPTEPRLRYIEKNFSPSVLVTVAIALFNAMGQDHQADLLDMQWDWRDGPSAEVVVEAVFARLEDIQAGDESLVTPFDPYLPWLASQLNRIYKPLFKKMKKVPALKPFVGDVRGDHNQYGALRLEPDLLHDWVWMQELSYDLENRFGSIVAWADGTGFDINQFSAQEALDASHQWGQMQPKGDIVPGEIVYEFDDGWTFQELTTRPQLECEGREDVLFHCVKSYKVRDIGVKYRIFSLRDPDGWPHATMEWKLPEEYVAQFKGYNNKMPERDEVKRAVKFRIDYIDKHLLSEDQSLDVALPNSPDVPPYVSNLRGFAAYVKPRSGIQDEFVVFGGIEPDYDPGVGVAVWSVDVDELVEHVYVREVTRLGPGKAAEAETAIELGRIDVVNEFDPLSGGVTWWDWAQWKQTGLRIMRQDELMIEIDGYGLRPSEFVFKNPRKAKRKKTPEYKRLLDRSQRLWETYDAKPLKKNLLAFGTHVERMEKSSSLKVKTEARRAARAFNAEFRARGWKK